MTDHVQNESGEVATIDTEVLSFGDDALARIAAEADARVASMKAIKSAALKLTNTRDWVSQGGNPWLCASGAEKIAQIGVKVDGITRQKMTDEDEKGRYYIWEYAGTFSIAGRSIEAIGTCSSRDKFFAIRDGELIPLGDVDQTNIMKSAYSNLLVNGISRLLGFRNITWQELQPAGIEAESVAKVTYGKGTEGGSSEDEKEQQRELAQICMALSDGDKERAGNILEGLTEFEGEDGKMISRRTAKSLKGKWLGNTLRKAREEYKSSFGVEYGEEAPEQDEDDGIPGLD